MSVIDERTINQVFSRKYGYALKGKKVIGKVTGKEPRNQIL